MSDIHLEGFKTLHVKQVREVAEWFGFESRNKYQILDEQTQGVAYAAEQQKGWGGWILRQFLGHWRQFDLFFYSSDRTHVMTAHHPFRFYFQCLEIKTVSGALIGSLEKRFSIFSKRFDVKDAAGNVVMEVDSPLWTPWTFPFLSGGNPVASIKKKWSGIFSEAFTDRDNFTVDFVSPHLTNAHRKLVLASAIFVDLQYFENKASRASSN